MKLTPLVKRTFKFKNPRLHFYCALCRTPRALVSSYKLSFINYLQITLLSSITAFLVYPLMSFRGVFSFFIFWAGFELVRRANYRKQIPCPHCGFDASWYRRDVKVARKLVAAHWAGRNQREEILEVPEELAHLGQDDLGTSSFDQGL